MNDEKSAFSEHFELLKENKDQYYKIAANLIHLSFIINRS